MTNLINNEKNDVIYLYRHENSHRNHHLQAHEARYFAYAFPSATCFHYTDYDGRSTINYVNY